MPEVNLASYDPMFKDRYHSQAIVNTLNNSNRALKWISQDKKAKFSGRQTIIPKKIGRHHSAGSIGPRGKLPRRGRSAWADSKVPIRDVYFAVEFDEYVIGKSSDNDGSFARVMAIEMKEAVRDAARQRNRMAWGDGRGILAVVNGAHAGVTTLEVRDPGAVTGTFNANRFLNGDVNDGDLIAILPAGAPTGAPAAVVVVTAVNPDGTDVTVDAAVTAADGDLIVLAQGTGTGQNSYGKEPEGFLASVDDGTYVSLYHDIDRSQVDIENATVVTGIGAFSPDAIQQIIDEGNIHVGAVYNTLFSEHALARAYMASIEVDKRYTGGQLMNPDSGNVRAKKPDDAVLKFGGISWHIDKDCPYGFLFGFDKATFLRYEMPTTGWADRDGSVLKWNSVDDVDAWIAFYHLFENWHCLQPSRNFRAEGFQVQNILAHSL